MCGEMGGMGLDPSGSSSLARSVQRAVDFAGRRLSSRRRSHDDILTAESLEEQTLENTPQAKSTYLSVLVRV